MGTRHPERLTLDTITSIVDDLGTETAASALSTRIDALKVALDDVRAGDDVCLAFLGAGGLPPLVRRLRGTAMSDAENSMSTLISLRAAEALSRLLRNSIVLSKVALDTDLVRPLVDAVHGGPHDLARCVAARALVAHGAVEAENRKAIAEARGVRCVLTAYTVVADSAWEDDIAEPILELGRMLIGSGGVGTRDLVKAIRAPQPLQSFAALCLLQDCLRNPTDAAQTGMKKAGIVEALKATLQHESPHSVAAAVGALSLLGQPPRGQGLSGPGDAMRALVRIIERSPGKSDSDMSLRCADDETPLRTELFSRGLAELDVEGRMFRHFRNPTALALGAMVSAGVQGWPLLDSFLSAGGIPALVPLINESSCLVTLYAALVVEGVLKSHPGAARRTEISDQFFEEGLCQALVQAVKRHSKNVHIRVVHILTHFLPNMLAPHPGDCECCRKKPKNLPTAMAELVRGGVVELTVDLMTRGELDMFACGLVLVPQYMKDALGQQRMCAPKLVDQLIKWIAKWIKKADGRHLLEIPTVLSHLLDASPLFTRAAIQANITASLVRIPRKAHQFHSSASMNDIFTGQEAAVRCLKHLLQYDMDNARTLWKTAMDAGITPVFNGLLMLGCEGITIEVVMASGFLMLSVPAGEGALWDGGITRAIAGLLTTSTTPKVVGATVDFIYHVGKLHPALIVDCRTWGIEDSLQQLTLHSYEVIAIGAKDAIDVLFPAEQLPKVANPLRQRQSTIPAATTSRSSSHAATTSSLTSHAATTSSPSSSPAPKSNLSTQPPTLPVPRSAGVTGIPAPSQRKAASGDGTAAASRSKPDKEQASGASDAKPRGKKESHVEASPGRTRKARSCAACGNTADMMESGKLLECTGCKSVCYCGRPCQKADWPAHKAICKSFQSKGA